MVVAPPWTARRCATRASSSCGPRTSAAVEKLARYGPERPPTVRDHFVDYVLTNPAALDVLRRHRFYLCNDPAFLDGEVSRACGETESRPV